MLDIISFISRISFQKFLLKWKSKTDSAASDESTQRALISTKRRTYNLDTQCHRPFSCKKIYLKEYLCFACPQALSSSLCFFWKSLDSRSFSTKKNNYPLMSQSSVCSSHATCLLINFQEDKMGLWWKKKEKTRGLFWRIHREMF